MIGFHTFNNVGFFKVILYNCKKNNSSLARILLVKNYKEIYSNFSNYKLKIFVENRKLFGIFKIQGIKIHPLKGAFRKLSADDKLFVTISLKSNKLCIKIICTFHQKFS